MHLVWFGALALTLSQAPPDAPTSVRTAPRYSSSCLTCAAAPFFGGGELGRFREHVREHGEPERAFELESAQSRARVYAASGALVGAGLFAVGLLEVPMRCTEGTRWTAASCTFNAGNLTVMGLGALAAGVGVVAYQRTRPSEEALLLEVNRWNLERADAPFLIGPRRELVERRLDEDPNPAPAGIRVARPHGRDALLSPRIVLPAGMTLLSAAVSATFAGIATADASRIERHQVSSRAQLLEIARGGERAQGLAWAFGALSFLSAGATATLIGEAFTDAPAQVVIGPGSLGVQGTFP